MITRIGLAQKFEATLLKIASDLHLVVSQVNGSYAAKGLTMAIYLKKVKELMQHFVSLELRQLSREKTSNVDALSSIAFAVHSTENRTIHVEFISKRSKSVVVDVVAIKEKEPNLIREIMDYIVDSSYPPDKSEAQKLRMKMTKYCMFYGHLYKRSF